MKYERSIWILKYRQSEQAVHERDLSQELSRTRWAILTTRSGCFKRLAELKSVTKHPLCSRMMTVYPDVLLSSESNPKVAADIDWTQTVTISFFGGIARFDRRVVVSPLYNSPWSQMCCFYDTSRWSPDLLHLLCYGLLGTLVCFFKPRLPVPVNPITKIEGTRNIFTPAQDR